MGAALPPPPPAPHHPPPHPGTAPPRRVHHTEHPGPPRPPPRHRRSRRHPHRHPEPPGLRHTLNLGKGYDTFGWSAGHGAQRRWTLLRPAAEPPLRRWGHVLPRRTGRPGGPTSARACRRPQRAGHLPSPAPALLPARERCDARRVTRVDDVPRLAVLGVPTTAGSHHAGQEKAPTALRSAGLVAALEAAGRQVEDVGDLAMRRHRPCPPVEGVRDLPRVVDLVREAADRVAEVHTSGARPVVLGGDCTVTLGVVAGLARHLDVGLVYVDGDADLNTPESSSSGVLDTMGVTHLLGGGAAALAGVGPRSPLLPADHLELFGFDPGELDTGQWTRLVEHRLSATPAPVVRQDPVQRAEAALRRLRSRTDVVLVHLDVDVLDTGAFPLANFPHAAGLTLPELAACLRVFCRSSAFAGLVLTEVNPDHDPDGELLRRLVEVLADALAYRPPATRSTAPVQ